MAEKIKLEVVTPEKYVVDEEVEIVVAPGVIGEFGVLIGHTPFLTTLKTGTVRYTDANGKERFVFVSGGFAEALPDKVTVLAESAERRRDIDVERAKAAQQRALDRLAQEKAEDIDFLRAQIALERAISRLNLAGTK
ncbi:MAG: F0F1 ATP synthase subunit epsilon [Desulfobacterales bacterium]|uniref:ATP synthase epsilon chain n=1 Tax=Candidatus Desulfatibia vada TaxID=2841696 RepID=A0A8J6NR29_9BACT|nr:F0F1 ATP synthase subunit epsilon [Candidatus Desulfatibia vada]MBL6971363.1 F0F1 ATP synthase subunit epsilon [Desulfobacterales bacterium]